MRIVGLSSAQVEYAPGALWCLMVPYGALWCLMFSISLPTNARGQTRHNQRLDSGSGVSPDPWRLQNFMQKKLEMGASNFFFYEEKEAHFKEIKIRIYYIFLSFIFT